MSERTSLFPLFAGAVTAFTLAASIILSSDEGYAADATASLAPPSSTADPLPLRKSFTAHVPSPHRQLDRNDELAALESLHFALSEVADGSSYVWHRSHGGLSGIIQIADSFRGDDRSICRRAIVVLTTPDVTRRTETVACRQSTGVWLIRS